MPVALLLGVRDEPPGLADRLAVMPRGRVDLSPHDRASIVRIWGRMEDAVARAGDEGDPFAPAPRG